jgi:hypothetical protein
VFFSALLDNEDRNQIVKSITNTVAEVTNTNACHKYWINKNLDNATSLWHKKAGMDLEYFLQIPFVSPLAATAAG